MTYLGQLGACSMYYSNDLLTLIIRTKRFEIELRQI